MDQPFRIFNDYTLTRDSLDATLKSRVGSLCRWLPAILATTVISLPRYDYQCQTCHNEFEVKQSFVSEPVATCPECKNQARRVIQSVPVVFKGSGFYVNDYGKGNSSTGNRSNVKESTSKEETKSGKDSTSKSQSKSTTESASKSSAESDKSSTQESKKRSTSTK